MKVSVIVPIYNVENYVEECIKSVLSQTLQEFELICVNDCGTDGSWEIVKNLAKDDSRIVLLENPQNLGLAATRNRGLEIAKGEYVYFLDSDDMIVKEALETLYNRAKQEQIEVQVFGASFIFETEELQSQFQTNHAQFKGLYPDITDGKSLFIKWMKEWDWLSSQPRYFYKREFLQNNQLQYIEGMLHEDEPFAFDVLMSCNRIKVTNDLFFIRRFRGNSIMTGCPTMKSVEGCIRILQHVSQRNDLYETNPDLNRAIKYYMYKIYRDACRKYKRIQECRQIQDGLINELSPEFLEEAQNMQLYNMIEAFAYWEEDCNV